MPVDSSIESDAADAERENHEATVLDVTPMDENREEEIASVVDSRREDVRNRLGREEELGSFADPNSGWEEAITELTDRGDVLGDDLEAWRGRLRMPYPSLVRVRFEVGASRTDPHDTGFEYVPGQYARISYDDEEPRVYSIASSPNSDHVELCIRRVPGGELTPDLCDELEAGDDLFVRGPFGDELMLKEPSDRDVVFVATGTGVAPFKSMIDYLFEEGMDEFDGENRDVWLFLGSSWEDHLPYREAFRAMDDEREHFHFVPTLSRETSLTDWTGETDYVQYCLLRYLDGDATDTGGLPEEFAEYAGAEPTANANPPARLNPDEMEVYVCGIGAMCDPVTDVVESLGVDEAYLDVESFG
ncbi:FAD-binding oxidoreductase [Halogeometricum limi]|uniref:CDP-4-dehydro-6-deoxyglucose reductase n=1 Tax=Halogeometricum limi TaxID=555875 RepID=A0A1I6FUE7_9EURY|nr:FAD-binding oxidoreductase [Halogeometricum limi]SFR33543.1 CDP-4-dehydro-6-deoxyglucose reductase [Halogeometricum limi]